VEVRALHSNIITRRFPATVYALNTSRNDIILPVNINESLNKIPAVYAHTGTFNTSRITMRGIGTRSLYGTRKINALFNDIPLTSGEGDTFIDDIDLQFVDRLEVLGGPTAGIYGPALGGTLLLYSVPAAQQNSLLLNTSVGSYGTFQNSVQANLSRESTAFSFKYKNVHSDGYRDNNNYDRHSALINFNRDGRKSSWSFLALFTGVKAEIPSSVDSASFYGNPKAAAATWLKTRGRENTQRFLAGVTHQYRFNNQLSVFTTLYGLYKKSVEVRPFNFMNEDDKSGGVKLYFRKKFKGIEGLTITQGISTFFERYQPSLFENIGGVGEKGSKIADNVENIYQANAFLIAGYAPDWKNYITISLNLNKFGFNDKNIFTSGSVQKYTHAINFSPRISVSRQLVVNHFVFGSISHGLSYPSMQEIIYPDGSINNDVNPERAWSFEAGFKGTQLFKELRYSISAYFMPVVDLIVPERIAEDSYVGKNVGKSKHTGVELSIEKADPLFSASSWFYLADYKLVYNWQSNKFGNFIQDGINYQDNSLPGVPENRMFASVNFRIGKLFFLEPEVYLNGETPMNDRNTRFYNSYSIANLRMGYLYDNNRWNLRLSCVINNILDEKYASMILINAPAAGVRPPRYYYPGMPRNFMLSLSFGFGS
jgi:iron complex outermembrane receptor protein